jgi:hypothetical protein|tara:strand:+ start:1138 stop:1344 length:207 start_codon:yes stop_codon:yes gene_type:complete
MGPYNEEKQLERRALVLSLLQKDNLSEWARAYWGNVFDKIALTEERYNARVYDTYKNIKRKEGFISYE